ncbi:MAG: outer membrane lipid asymmetry maintenance protein MlaD [Hyphomonadaceae bacterium]|nr:outer membrane lipid asymmetry maintenance protein MlaD [Hyphomonadaceae bacterium]
MNLKEQTAETILGALVALVAIGFFAFASAQSGRNDTRGGYDLTARFQRVDGIAVGSDVRVSGVKVGAVKSIALDPATYMAKLTLTIDRGVEVLDQSTARVQSNGLLGDAYVSIEPAGVDPLAAGAEIANTQGAIDLLTVLASAMSSMGSQKEKQE